jgi:hypothetical protein
MQDGRGTAPATATVDVPISYVQDVSGNIQINVPGARTVHKDQVANFVLTPSDATNFDVVFKSTNPFNQNDHPSGKIDKDHPKTGGCKGNKGVYEYTVVFTTKTGTTVTVDPVIIVEGAP